LLKYIIFPRHDEFYRRYVIATFFRKLIIILFILPVLLNAQSLLELYQDHIPDKLIQDEDYREEIEENLSSHGALDPDLIYFYMVSLQLTFEKNIQDPDSNLTLLLASKIAKAKRLKRQWANTSISEIGEKHGYSVRTRKLESYYRKYATDRYPDRYGGKDWTVDQNLQYYFKYLYLSRAKQKYDPNMNYKQTYNNQLSTMISYFDSVFKADRVLESHSTETIIQEALKVTYIFNGTYIRTITQTTDFYLFAFIHKLLEQDYLTYNRIFLQFDSEVAPRNHTVTYSFTDPMNFDYDYYYDLNISNTMYLSLGYIFKLKEEKSPASFIRLSIGYAFYQSYENIFEDTLIYSGKRERPSLRFKGDYIFTNFRNSKTHSFTAQAALPILYFNKRLYTEIEFSYVYLNHQFEFDFIKRGTLESLLEDISLEWFNDKVIKINENYNDLYFGISLNYSIIDQCTIRLGYLFPTNIRLGFTLNYHL